MASAQIRYRSGNYKYQLAEIYTVEVGLHPDDIIDIGILFLSTSGELVIHNGYAWDGPSGPSIDTKDFMRGSLVHDALYQLMRAKLELLPSRIWRKQADIELRKICREDGMNRFRAWYVYRAVRLFRRSATDPENRSGVITAP